MSTVAFSRSFRLMVIADLDLVGDQQVWLERINQAALAADENVVIFQIRARSVEDSELEDTAQRALDVIRSVNVRIPVVLNGSETMAVHLGFDGFHIRESQIHRFRPISSPLFRSVAVHSLEVVQRHSESLSADVLVCSPIFLSTWKNSEPRGLKWLKEMVEATKLPVFALGGVTPARVKECIHAGAAGVAILSGIMGVTDPGDALRRYSMSLMSATS